MSEPSVSVPKPVGLRPAPRRRMMSFESGQFTPVTGASQASDGTSTPDDMSIIGDDPTSATPWTDKPIVQSPKPSDVAPSFLAQPQPASRGWAILRKHALPSGAAPATHPSLFSHSRVTSSDSLSYQSIISTQSTPTRGPSPAPSNISAPAAPVRSRFARLAFRSATDSHVSQAPPLDASIRLAQEVLHACHIARFGVPTNKSGASVGLVTLGSIPSSFNPTIGSAALSRRSEVSVASQTFTSGAFPSLRQLHQVLVASSAPAAATSGATLPHEAQVMAVCLKKFLAPYETPSGAEDDGERLLALDCWNVVIKAWVAEPPLTRAVPLIKAALSPSPHRSRLLHLLSFVMFPPPSSSVSPTIHPYHFLSYVQGLLTLLSVYLPTSNEAALAHQLLRRLFSGPPPIPGSDSAPETTPIGRGGAIGTPQALAQSDMQTVYGVAWERGDTEGDVRRAMGLDALSRAIDGAAVGMGNVHGPEMERWCALMEEYWPFLNARTLTPLLTSILHSALTLLARTLMHLPSPSPHPVPLSPVSTFSSPSFSPPAFSSPNLSRSMPAYSSKAVVFPIMRIFQTRILPTVELLKLNECRGSVVMLLCHITSVNASKGGKGKERAVEGGWEDWVKEKVNGWCMDKGWKEVLEGAVKTLILETPLSASTRAIITLLDAIDEEKERRGLVASFLPVLFERLCSIPSSASLPHTQMAGITAFLTHIAQGYPQVFFKPVFALAAAANEAAVGNKLEVLYSISRFFPRWWHQSAEMLSVALLRDPAGPTSGSKGRMGSWGKWRLGQVVLLLELVAKVHAARIAKEAGGEMDRDVERDWVDTVKYIIELEGRLGILLDNKEKHTLVPPLQRRLFCKLFLEMRLLTKSLKSAKFIPLIISWLLHAYNEPSDPPLDADLEFDVCWHSLSAVYENTAASINSFDRRNPVMSPSLQIEFATSRSPSSTPFSMQLDYIKSMPQEDVDVLQLLVALSGALGANDYKRMMKTLWDEVLDVNDAKSIIPACFLVMQCASKIEHEFQSLIRRDLRSDDPFVKLYAIQRIITLTDWRFQLLSQPVILDKTHRRPFKHARGAQPIITTDIGSNVYIHEVDTVTSQGAQKRDTLPLELRKRLEEIGWAQEETVVDERIELTMRPMTLLPSYQLDKADGHGGDVHVSTPPASPGKGSPLSPMSPDPRDGGLVRKKSMSSGAMKRRAVFVPALAALFPDLASLVFDPHFMVASPARSALMDLMRNDPNLISRPILDLLLNGEDGVIAAVSTLRAFLHVRRQLPPTMAYLVFNNLTGFLKHIAKEHENADAFKGFAHAIPILSKLVTQVSGMSILEIRRAKVDIFLVPSSSLWFPPSAPLGPMFPRRLTFESRSESVPPALVGIVMIRIAQNMGFLSLLKKNPQEVQVIRKSISRFALPSRDADEDGSKPLELTDFVPRKFVQERLDHSTLGSLIKAISLMLSRSYVLLVGQVFRSMSRHLSNRSELALLVDGINKVLLAHGDDIGIHSCINAALMAAGTRFRRLFNDGGGFTLFMPAVIKVYAESEQHTGIRQAIEYACVRFYALHREAFVFQTLDAVAHIMMVPNVDGDWLAKSVHHLLSALREGVTSFTEDAAAIHDANKTQEREALLLTTADEKPQAFLAAFTSGGDINSADVPEEYESKRLSIDNIVRLFLTVIAHNPGMSRAEHFLRLLRYLVPYLYESNDARPILKEGIGALGTILARAALKAKAQDVTVPKPKSDFNFGAFEEISGDQFQDKSKVPSNLSSMRRDYLMLILAFIDAGGLLERDMAGQVFELIKLMLRDSFNSDKESMSLFFTKFTKSLLLRENKPSIKEVITYLDMLSPWLTSYNFAVDFSGTFEAIAQISADSTFANNFAFARVVVTQFCAAGLDAWEVATSRNARLHFPLNNDLVNLIANAMFFPGADAMAVVEKRTPSYNFLIGIILPLVLTMKTSAAILADADVTKQWRQTVCPQAWIRLLAYVMSACRNRNRASRISDSGKSQGKHPLASEERDDAGAVAIAIQIIKIIVVKAESDLSSCLPGIWPRIGSLLRSLLSEGDASFAYTPRSALPSPQQSPRASMSVPDFRFSQSLSGGSAVVHSSGPALPPRVLDYVMWSLFELLCLCKSALVLQLRPFMKQKVGAITCDLKSYHQLGLGSRSRRNSSTFAFTKPRHRLSSTPVPNESSPQLTPSQSLATLHASPSQESINVSRQAGYQRSAPASPTTADYQRHGPRIVHLGPVPWEQSIEGSMQSGERSPGFFGTLHIMETSGRIKSEALIAATYRRVCLVMRCFGHDPSSFSFAEGNFDQMNEGVVWTKKQAIQVIERETKELELEFEDISFSDMNHSTSFVQDAGQMLSF